MSIGIEKFWEVATDEALNRWRKIYGSVDVMRELFKMEEWLCANPSRAKKNYPRFIVNWLTKAQRDAEAIETREIVQADIRRQMARNY